jgi:hypothetical protein
MQLARVMTVATWSEQVDPTGRGGPQADRLGTAGIARHHTDADRNGDAERQAGTCRQKGMNVRSARQHPSMIGDPRLNTHGALGPLCLARTD